MVCLMVHSNGPARRPADAPFLILAFRGPTSELVHHWLIRHETTLERAQSFPRWTCSISMPELGIRSMKWKLGPLP